MIAFTEADHLGEPVVITRGYQLCSLLTVCEQAVRSLDNVGDGNYRDNVTSSLANVVELAESIARDMPDELEQTRPKRMTGGQRNG